ncbi:LacI family transcriptional regulator, partial [Candidatus Bathyarchaeota archaeon]
EHELSIILSNTDEDSEKEEEVIQTMLAERVDGLLITPVQTRKDTTAKLKESGVPFVLLGRYFNGLETDYVVSDDVQGGFLATEHLIRLGHKRIGMINGPLYISSAKERFQGYKKALDHYGIKLDKSIVSTGALTTEDGYKVTKALLVHRTRPTSIFAYSDFVAFGVIRAVHEDGLRIPEDIAVVGYDDVGFSSCLEIPLTTVRIPKEKLGSKAMESLVSKMSSGRKFIGFHKIKLPVELIIRGTT